MPLTSSPFSPVSPAGEPEFIYHPIFVKAGSLIINQAKQVPGLENVYLDGCRWHVLARCT